MPSAIITLSNNEKIKVFENQLIFPITNRTDKDNHVCSCINPAKALWNHVSYGLIPSLTDIFVSCDFFTIDREDSKVYSVTSIVSIETE